MKLLLLSLVLLPLPAGSFLTASARRRRRRGILRAEKKPHASSYDRFNEKWNTMFEKLKEYEKEHGDCLVPQRYMDDPPLGYWVMGQRAYATLDDKMKNERRDKLNSIGFVWSVKPAAGRHHLEERWKCMFEELKSYKEKHGDCLVPESYKTADDAALGAWVRHQRRRCANGNLRKDRVIELESIGFVWRPGKHFTPLEKQWDAMFERLRHFQRANGHCNVPLKCKADPALGKWVQTQRLSYQRGLLVVARQKRLDSIGFVWSPLVAQWEDMFERLEAYQSRHGDCLVPTKYQADPQLGFWVSNMRLRRATLSKTRQERLESIGFVWSVKPRKSHDPAIRKKEAGR